MPSSTALGDEFEVQVLDLLRREIETDRFYFKRECCQIFHKKGYYSEDRKDEIIFDIAIELTMPGAERYSSLILIECKRLSRPVEVGDVQLFFSSIEQIAGARDKGIMVSSGGYTKQALEFAQSKGIGLVRHFPEDGFKWQLRRSLVGSRWTNSDANEIERGLLINDYEDANSAFYCFAPASPVQTFNELLAALLGGVVDAALAQRLPSADVVVQFLSREDIDREAKSVLEAVGYQGGPAPLESIEHHHGLHVVRGAVPGAAEMAGNILGRAPGLAA